MGARPGARATPPTLSAASLSTVTACPRRLARHLDPQDRPYTPVNDGRFRLGRAVQDALRAAHEQADLDGAELDDVLDLTPPPELGLEEARRFRAALEHYGELAGQRPGRLHPAAGETRTRPSQDGTWALKAELGLVVRTPDGAVELRRVTCAPAPPPRGDGLGDADLARVALLGALAEGPVRVQQLWTEGTATVRDHTVTAADLAGLRDRLGRLVDTARATPERTVEGWWCTSCPCLPGCPAVPATRIAGLLP